MGVPYRIRTGVAAVRETLRPSNSVHRCSHNAMKGLLSCAALSALVRACPIPYIGQVVDMRQGQCPATAREVNLSTHAARERLRPSAKPYCRSLDQGLHLGYRKGVRGAAW